MRCRRADARTYSAVSVLGECEATASAPATLRASTCRGATGSSIHRVCMCVLNNAHIFFPSRRRYVDIISPGSDAAALSSTHVFFNRPGATESSALIDSHRRLQHSSLHSTFNGWRASCFSIALIFQCFCNTLLGPLVYHMGPYT